MFYETVVILRPELSSQQAESLVLNFKNVLSERGGILDDFEYAGLRAFAYPIRKYRKGHYFLLNITSSSEAIQEMCRLMRLSEDVLRHLNIKVDVHAPLPSPLAQTKGYRDDKYDGQTSESARAEFSSEAQTSSETNSVRGLS